MDSLAPPPPGSDWLNPQASTAVRTIARRGKGHVVVVATVLLAVGVVVWGATGFERRDHAPLGFHLEELNPDQTGISFVHEKGALSPFFDNIKPFMQAVSASACTADIDNDGDLDLLLTTSGDGHDNHLYWNDAHVGQPFRFRRSAIRLGNNGTDGFSTDCVFADIDNDGYVDLFLGTASQRPHLYKNVPTSSPSENGRTFVDITEEAGLHPYMNGFAASFFDVENDGDLDLITASYFGENYLEEDIPGRPRMHTFRMPDHPNAGRMLPNNWGDATNGGPKHFHINDGTGHFTEEDNDRWGLALTRFTFDIGTADVNQDGYTDVYFSNDFGPDQLYINDHGQRFIEQRGTLPNEVGQDPFKGMNAELADIDGDAYPEIYVTNVFHPILPEGNILWQNLADASTVSGRNFQNVAADKGVNDGGWGWGARFVDLDVDGDKDLVATNGYISQHPKKDYWYRLSRLVAGDRRLIVDSRKWPLFEDRSMSGHQRSHIFVNDGHRFHDRAEDAGVDRTFDGRGVLFADFDIDGRPEVMIIPQGAPLFFGHNVFRSTTAQPTAPHWVGVVLKGDGLAVNRDAVGVHVEVKAPSGSQHFETSAGNGLSAQSTNWVVAGVGNHDQDVDVLLRWTNGTTSQHRLAVDRYHDIQLHRDGQTTTTPHLRHPHVRQEQP
jgi:enediyne biosynthesis protein E4